MALEEWSLSKLTRRHCSQSLWLACGDGPAVMSAISSFPALMDGPGVGAFSLPPSVEAFSVEEALGLGRPCLGLAALPALSFFPLGSQSLSPSWLVVSGSTDTMQDLAVPGSRKTNRQPRPQVGPAPGRCVSRLVLCSPSGQACAPQGHIRCVLIVAGLRKPERCRAAPRPLWVPEGFESGWGSRPPLWGIEH